MRLSISEWQRQFGRPIETFALAALSVALLTALVNPAGAQSDGEAARIDAMFATPYRYGVVPQDNLYATTPGLEQQAPPGSEPVEARYSPRCTCAGRSPARRHASGSPR